MKVPWFKIERPLSKGATEILIRELPKKCNAIIVSEKEMKKYGKPTAIIR